MRRLIAVVLALAAFTLPALAQTTPFDWNTYSQFDVSDVPTGDFTTILSRRLLGVVGSTTGTIVPRDVNMRWCENLRYGTPGHMNPVQPYARMWVYAVGESAPGYGGTQFAIYWRQRAWYPGDYTKIYHTGWQMAGVVGYRDTLYTYPLLSADSLDSVGWLYDIELRVVAATLNDSCLVSLGVMRRTWK